jgi:uncharacterized protein
MIQWNPSPMRQALAILLATAAAVAAGCAPYGLGMQRVLDRLVRGDPASALAQLEKKPREDDALYQLERGLLLRLAGRTRESTAAFEAAHGIAEDLYTKSVGREAAALAVTDRIRPYRPPTHELLLARHYEARNYLDEGDIEGAAVEARRIGLLFDEIASGSQDPPADGDLLARLTGALILEAAGEPDNALVFYRNILREARDPRSGLRLSLPEWLAGRARRLADEVGVDLSSELPPDSAAQQPPAPPSFTAVVFVETGLVPPRTESRISVPILKSEEEKDMSWVGGRVGERALVLRGAEWTAPEPAEIAYWLELALPAYGPDPFLPTQCEVSACGRFARGSQAADVASSARATLEREMPGIALRTALRALIKYAAHHQAEEKGGTGMGILVNILGAATEQAETRTWLSLPHQIDLAVLDLPVAVDTVGLSVWDSANGERSMRVPLHRSPGSSIGFGSYRN